VAEGGGPWEQPMNIIEAGLTGWLLVGALLIFAVAIWREWL
jgi:hypothetical protein